MREIKFRAWDLKAKRMDEVWPTPNGCGFYDDRSKDVHEYFDGMYSDVMQYTGLKDRSGKEIYEGDVLDDNHDGWLWVVGFNDRGCFIAHAPDEKSEWVLLDDYHFSVIGNIYENPELLT